MTLSNKPEKSKTVFYEKISIIDVVYALVVFRKSNVTVKYFDSTPAAKRFLGDNNSRIKMVKDGLSDICEQDGGSTLPRIYGKDLNEYIATLINNKLSKNGFLRRLKARYGEKIELCFSKYAYSMSEELFINLNIIKHISEISGQIEPSFIIPKKPFMDQLRVFAKQKYGIDVRGQNNIGMRMRALGELLVVLTLNLRSVLIAAVSGENRRNLQEPKIAGLYAMKGFTLNKYDRCDFSWLLFMENHKKNYLMYFDRQDVPADQSMADELRKHGIARLAMSKKASSTKDIPVSRLSRLFAERYVSGLLYVLWSWLRNITEMNELDLLVWAVKFNAEYSKYFNIFKTNGIIVNMDFIDFDPLRVARHIALDHAGGISITYQVSNWPIPTFIHTSAADIRFIFGKYYEGVLNGPYKSDTQNIIAGYMNDYAFENIKQRAAEIRAQFIKKGAEYIICYFDENSSDKRNSSIPNTRAKQVYKKLSEMVVQDKSIGMIFSPKRPQTIKNRLGGEVWGSVSKALETGRCFLSDGKYMTSKYPAELSMASDMTITLLLGGTTALECVLAGQKVMYLDLEKMFGYDDYKEGRDTFIFNDLEKLVSAIYECKNNESCGKYLTLGRSRTIDQKDPFRDGKAAVRMAEYISFVFDGLAAGDIKAKAINNANELFRKKWGEDKVVTQNKEVSIV